MGRKYDEVTHRIAGKEGVAYNPGTGVDVRSARRAIEVETSTAERDGIRQLQGYRKPAHMAGTDDRAVQAALDATRGTRATSWTPRARW